MFTIKHIDRNNTQHLISTDSVWYTDNSEEVAGTNKPVVRAVHYSTNETVEGVRVAKVLTFGTVYVMNYNGKTIADYHLD